jgi:hypothetical protein
MAGNTTTVTHPDGTVSKRTSKTREYTHAIQVSPADPYILAEHFRREAVKADRMAAKLRDAADVGTITIRSRGFAQDGDSLHSHVATLLGTDREIYTWCSKDGQMNTYPEPYPAGAVVVPADQGLRANARRQADAYTASAVKLREQADATLAAGAPVGAWTVERWSSRQDLAMKALGTFAYLTERGHQVRVVPVDAPKTQDPAPVPAVEWDPSEDCTDTCCVEAAAQDVELADLGTLTEADQVPTMDPVSRSLAVLDRSAVLAQESTARAVRIAAGDIVTIHRGHMLREVLDVSEDLVRVVPVDPDDTTDPWWTPMDLVHRSAPVPVNWGTVLEIGGQMFAVMSDGDQPYLKAVRS